MKTIATFTLIIIIISSCCFGNRKCVGDDDSARFRLVRRTDGSDLVFGSSRLYDKNSIRFYSLRGTDTIDHYYGPGPGASLNADSLLYVNGDHRQFDTVYLKLTTTDTDTLLYQYATVDGQCCPDFRMVRSVIYNNVPVSSLDGGYFLLRK
jgi:hypothetical protein